MYHISLKSVQAFEDCLGWDIHEDTREEKYELKPRFIFSK
jgi:hypothetical protein